MHISALDTPAVLIDVDVMEHNIRRASEYCRQRALRLRPHTKTHKIPELAHLQVRNGATGITVAKVGEAEVMADAGLDDILIVYPLLGEKKLARLTSLARRARITVALDSLEVAQRISEAYREGVPIGPSVEFDTGFGRCGLPIDRASIEVARAIQRLPALEWRGVLVYPGHIMGNAFEREGLIERENERLRILMDLLDGAGLERLLVSGGNTPAMYQSYRFVGATEIRPGTYIFNDKNTVCAEAATYANCAVSVLTRVVSRSVWEKAIVDAGSKTLSGDLLLSGDRRGYGYIMEYPDIAVHDLSEEHGHLDLRGAERRPALGELIRVIPNHVCTCINMHERVYGVRRTGSRRMACRRPGKGSVGEPLVNRLDPPGRPARERNARAESEPLVHYAGCKSRFGRKICFAFEPLALQSLHRRHPVAWENHILMKALCVLVCWYPALLAAGHHTLLPQPQRVEYGEGRLALRGLSVALAGTPAPEDSFAAKTLSGGLARRGAGVPSGPGDHTLRLIRSGAVDALPRDQEQPGPNSRESYHLRITPNGGEVRAPSSAGLFYAVQTLLQLVEGSGKDAALPAVEIDDWPSLAYRGVMFDLSHGPMPTEDEIKRQIDFLARWKGNQYYFYSELSIDLKGYPLINPGGRYTQDQVRRIIAYARERHVDVVPCLEFFGHLHDLFRIERYADLAALPHGGDLNPRSPEMQRMLDDWVGQMAALFPSPWFHIGLDEPWELERAGNAGGIEPGKLYLDHLNHMSGLVRRHGKRVLFWADVASGANLFEKYPQLASSLPEGVLPVPWYYHVAKDYSMMLEPFQKARVPEIIATGIWAWETIVPDFGVTFANIDGFVRDGRRYGTLGIINTNWADDAQVLFRMTQPGVAYGAIAAWQPGAVDREHFFLNYCSALYDEETAAHVAPALTALDAAQQAITAAVGSEDMFRLWDDPLAPPSLARAQAHVQELHTARLKAEEAQEHLQAAVAGDPESLACLLLGARLLDYAGMKFLYAVEIADIFAKLGAASPSRADLSFWLGRQMGDRNHSRVGDLMDLVTELRDLYRASWQAEYTPYRLGAALGRFDAEYAYWRRFQARLWEVRRNLKEGSPAPTLDSVRH